MMIKKEKRKQRVQSATYIGLVVPAFTLFLIFFIYPFLRSFYLSFTDAYGYNQQIDYIGLGNYIETISSPRFINALVVTLKYSLFVTVAGNLTALLLSLLLDEKIRLQKLFRAVFFLPSLMSLIIVGFVWVFIYGDVYQSIASSLSVSKVNYISFLGNPQMAIYYIGITAIWQSAGYYMIIYIAGLQGISKEVIESAQIDGASKLATALWIKIPMIFPVIIINVILLMTSSLKTFDFPMVMTSGGPAEATTTIALLIYNTGFRANRTGYATAQSILLFFMISVVTIVLFWVQSRKEQSR